MNTKIIMLILYLFALSIFIAHFFITKGAVYGDGRYYYAYLPTVFVHHTLNFTQAFKRLGIDLYQTPLHYPANKYSIGSATVWTIPYLFVNFMLMPFHANDGYNNIYQIAVGIWNISLVFTGLYFLRKTLMNYFSEKIANLTIIFLFLGTNLLFYGAVDVINSHSASFFAAAMFVYLWMQKRTVKQSILLGFFLGLLTLIRSQDILFIILPVSTLVIETTAKRRSIRLPENKLAPVFQNKFIGNLILDIGIYLTFLATYLPQLILWKLLWGSWYVNPYLLHEQFYFLQPNFLGVLFGKSSGLFLWTPLIIICAAGLFLFAKIRKADGIPIFLLFFLELYTVASWSTWWQGASYSGRMFVSSLPVLGIGLGYLLSHEKFRRITLPVSILFCFLNPLLIVIFLLTLHHHKLM